jgi:hypothetical protein
MGLTEEARIFPDPFLKERLTSAERGLLQLAKRVALDAVE